MPRRRVACRAKASSSCCSSGWPTPDATAIRFTPCCAAWARPTIRSPGAMPCELAMERSFHADGVEVVRRGADGARRAGRRRRSRPTKCGPWRTSMASGRQQPLLLSSILGQVGNTQGASSLVSLLKAILEVSHGELPPAVGLESPAPAIAANPNLHRSVRANRDRIGHRRRAPPGSRRHLFARAGVSCRDGVRQPRASAGSGTCRHGSGRWQALRRPQPLRPPRRLHLPLRPFPRRCRR